MRETWTGKSVDLAFLESLIPQENAELLGLMGLAERFAPLLFSASTVQANPRLVKRFLNTVFLRKTLAKPQNINVDVQVLAKWHLLERCDDAILNALAEKVSAENDGKVEILREEAAKDQESKLPSPLVTSLLRVSGSGWSRFLVTWIYDQYCISVATARSGTLVQMN